MMMPVENIFQEYTRLRLNGLDANEAILTLQPYLAAMNAETRDELAKHLRAWESKKTEAITQEDRARLAAAAKARDTKNTMDCPTCGRPNVPQELICYACGNLLHPDKVLPRTNVLPLQTGELQNDAYFGGEMNLLLIPESESDPFLLQPQKSQRELAIGRADKQELMAMDIDLEPLNAAQYGVSRLHASLRYDANSETVSIMDLGSTNGTYLNEQRLHANERRVLRNGDALRFGRFAMRVVYRNKN